MILAVPVQCTSCGVRGFMDAVERKLHDQMPVTAHSSAACPACGSGYSLRQWDPMADFNNALNALRVDLNTIAVAMQKDPQENLQAQTALDAFASLAGELHALRVAIEGKVRSIDVMPVDKRYVEGDDQYTERRQATG